MEITMRYVRGHVEVYTTAGQFLFSADTEAEAAAMLDRLYQVLGGKTDVVSEKAFADDVKIGDWARGSVYAMRQTGIMQGKENNQFCPTDGYTAEQSIVTIERMYQIIK